MLHTLPVTFPAYVMILLVISLSAMAIRRKQWVLLACYVPFWGIAALLLWVVLGGGPLLESVLNVGDYAMALLVVTGSAIAVHRFGWRELAWFVLPLMLAADGLWNVFGGTPSKARDMLVEGICLMLIVQALMSWKMRARPEGS
jgi:hypothetical protein